MWSCMGKKFEVGKSYECANFHYKPIKILHRTKKHVVVDNGDESWGARIRIDYEGDEYIQRSSMAIRYRGIETYSASWEI